MFHRSKRIIPLILVFGIIVNIIFSYNNINKYDNYRERSDGAIENHMIRSDILFGWKTAEKIRQNLQEKKFFDAIPVNDRWFLPCILIGTYFYIIDEQIFEKDEVNPGEKKIKKNNGKLGFLIFQIILFYLSLFYLGKKLKKKFNQKNITIILILLSFEPTILQWHSSFWSESIYISMFIILIGKLININQKNSKNLFIGLLIGIMFAQRSASFLLIIPIFLYYVTCFKKEIKPYFFLFLGYFIFISFMGVNHQIKTGKFFVLPYHSQLYSNYHYMLHEMKAKSENKSKKVALEEKIIEEKNWMEENKINPNNFNDIFLIINYRNKEFFKEVLNNPIDSVVFLINKIFQAAILDPFWVKKNLFLDKSIENYYLDFNKDIFLRIIYSAVFYLICLIGLIYLIYDYFNSKKEFKKYNFLLLNFLIISYFYLFAGGYGVSRYFIPTLVNFSFFFIIGLNFIFNRKVEC